MVTRQEVRPITADFNFIINATYRKVAEEEGYKENRIYENRLCVPCTEVLIKILRENGIKAEDCNTDWIPIVVNHHWPLIPDNPNEDFTKNPQADGIVIDIAWQQFLRKSNPALPKALICRRSQLRRVLSEFGITGDKQLPWTAALPASYIEFKNPRDY